MAILFPVPATACRTAPPWSGGAALEILDVPRSACGVFAAAERYLCADPRMREIFECAERAGRTIHLRVNHHDDDSFDPGTDTVNWDPFSALRTTDGGKQSPALGLGHELDHATVRASVRERGTRHRDPHYDNAEERRVVCGSERHAARVLGEGVRHDHGGTSYRVSAPTVC